MAIRLVLADDHPVVLSGLEALFAGSDEFAVLVGCADGASALEAIRTHRPDVAVVDIRMPHASGLDILRHVKAEGLATRIVLLTVEIDDAQTMEAIRQGVRGVVLKQMASRLLRECVRKVHAGEFWVEKESLRRVVERLLRETAAGETMLTGTETRVLRLVCEQARNKEIAERLNIAESTVKNHLHAVYSKLRVANRKALVARARELGLV